MNNEIILAPIVSMIYFVLAFYCLVGVFLVVGDWVMNGDGEWIDWIDQIFGIVYTFYRGE